MKIIHYYRKTETPHSLLPSIKEQLSQLSSSSKVEDASTKILSIETESCFNVQIDDELDTTSTERLEWLLRETFEKDGLRLETSTFDGDSAGTLVAEFGPRMTFTSAFSSNATSICAACGLTSITRLERSKRYKFTFSSAVSSVTEAALKKMLYDRMTEEEYLKPLTTFESGAKTEPVVWVPIMEEGRKALEKINNEKGLGFDDFDLDFYTELFKVSFREIILIVWADCVLIRLIGYSWLFSSVVQIEPIFGVEKRNSLQLLLALVLLHKTCHQECGVIHY